MYKQKGFTVLEVTIVAAIIAILAAVLTPIAVNMMDKADITRSQSDVNALITALEIILKRTPRSIPPETQVALRVGFQSSTLGIVGQGGATFAPGVNYGGNSDRLWNHFILNGNNRYPAWDGVTLIGWHGPYLAGDTIDPWGHPYIIDTSAFNSPGTTFYAWILSAGPDGRFQTDDENTTVLNGDDIGKWIYH